MNPLISIVIVNYNSGPHLSRCLSDLAREGTQIPLEAIVVDNGSEDESFK